MYWHFPEKFVPVLLRITEFQECLNFLKIAGVGSKKYWKIPEGWWVESFDGIPGEGRKKQWKITGGVESFDGVPCEERKKTMENSKEVVKVLMEFQEGGGTVSENWFP